MDESLLKAESTSSEDTSSEQNMWFTPTSLRRWLYGAYFPEYMLVPGFYYAGKFGYYNTALALQGGFVLGSSAFQYLVYADCKRWTMQVGDFDQLDGNVQTIMGIPVHRLGIPRVAFEFLSQAPNYIHVQQAAVVAGTAQSTWSEPLRIEFARRWAGVPLLGGAVGWLGLPGSLRVAIGVSCVSHGIAASIAYLTDKREEQADAANLLFLGKVFENEFQKELSAVSASRFHLAFISKIPMAWLKTSSFTLTYACLDDDQLRANVVGILLAWYAFAPIIPTWILPICRFRDRVLRLVSNSLAALREERTRKALIRQMLGIPRLRLRNRFKTFRNLLAVCLILLFVLLFVLLFLIKFILLFVMMLHFIGAFACQSHDLSILHGCTTMSNISLCLKKSV